MEDFFSLLESIKEELGHTFPNRIRLFTVCHPICILSYLYQQIPVLNSNNCWCAKFQKKYYMLLFLRYEHRPMKNGVQGSCSGGTKNQPAPSHKPNKGMPFTRTEQLQ